MNKRVVALAGVFVFGVIFVGESASTHTVHTVYKTKTVTVYTQPVTKTVTVTKTTVPTACKQLLAVSEQLTAAAVKILNVSDKEVQVLTDGRVALVEKNHRLLGHALQEQYKLGNKLAGPEDDLMNSKFEYRRDRKDCDS